MRRKKTLDLTWNRLVGSGSGDWVTEEKKADTMASTSGGGVEENVRRYPMVLSHCTLVREERSQTGEEERPKERRSVRTDVGGGILARLTVDALGIGTVMTLNAALGTRRRRFLLGLEDRWVRAASWMASAGGREGQALAIAAATEVMLVRWERE